jgi:arylsulfatase A-like enzyme
MSDDMGYSDVGCYGGEIATPNLDALAFGGLRFTQCYNNARCCPTRAALVTGRYPHQVGIGHMMDDLGFNAYRGNLSHNSPTIAELLGARGYRTYLSGKWHLTREIASSERKEQHNWPIQRGFDRFYGTIHGAGSFFDPNSLTRQNKLISPYADSEYVPDSFYYTDAITDHACRFLSEHSKDHSKNPFFMYVAFTAPHWPMHAKREDIAKYEGKYAQGYQEVRFKRLERMKELGVVDSRIELEGSAVDWSNPALDRRFEERNMEVFAAMIDSMDEGIGRIVAQLKSNGQYENTLILYFQDNGGCAETMGRGKRALQKTERADLPSLEKLPSTYLQDKMIPTQTRDGYPVRQGMGVLAGDADTYIGYGEGWANVSNTPFREYKHWLHEGGISTPLIAHWPAGISKEQVGKLNHKVVHVMDMVPTSLATTGTKPNSVSASLDAGQFEGQSFSDAFVGAKWNRLKPIYWEHEGNRAMRDGDWKIVSKHPGDWELYNIREDRAEADNLASREKERLVSMAQQWEAWSKEVGVQPWPIKSTEK